MEKIELEAKTDRELLILSIVQQNELIDMVKTINVTLFNNGWGVVAQVKVLWLCAAAVLAAIVRKMI